MSGTPRAFVLSVAFAVALPASMVTSGCGGRTHPERDAGNGERDGGDDGDCPDCSDGVPCTRDTCVGSACVHEPDETICETEDPCRVPDCDPESGCSAELLPDGTWCGSPGADGAPPPVCDAGECLPQRVVGVTRWGTMQFETPVLDADGYLTQLTRVTDRDGNGVDDLAATVVSLRADTSFVDTPGGVSLYSFPGGETLWRIAPEEGEMNLGRNLSTPGDLDGDGATDLVFQFSRDGAGWVRAVEASRGETLWEVPAESDLLDLVGDLDGDGVRDLAVCEPYAGQQPGALILLSARSGDELNRLEPDPAEIARYLHVVSLGDVNGDSLPDLAVEAEAADLRSSALLVLSASDLSSLATWNEAQWNGPVVPLGDLTGDGLADLLIIELTRRGAPSTIAADLWRGDVLWTSARLPPSSATYDLDVDSHRDFTAGEGVGPYAARTWRSAATGEVLFEADSLDANGVPIPVQDGAHQVPDANGDGADDWAIAHRAPPGALLIMTATLEVRR